MWKANHVVSAHVYPMTAAQQRVLRRLSVDKVSASLTRVMASLVLLLRMVHTDCAAMDNAYRAVLSSAVLRERSALMGHASLILVLTSHARASRAVTRGGVWILAVTVWRIRFALADVVRIIPA